jgi:hypothetical protein
MDPNEGGIMMKRIANKSHCLMNKRIIKCSSLLLVLLTLLSSTNIIIQKENFNLNPDNKGTNMKSSSVPILRDFLETPNIGMAENNKGNEEGSIIPISEEGFLNNSKYQSVYSEGFIPNAHFDIKDNFSSGWADTRLNRRKNITVDSDKVIGDLVNFTLLLDLYDSDLLNYAQMDGDDIMFYGEQGDQLNHEIEVYDPYYNSTHAHLVAWIQVDLTSFQDTLISMYFGNNSIQNQENPEGVWNTEYIAVWHLDEFGNGTIDEYSDSTSYNNDGQGGGGVPTQTPTPIFGQIGGAQYFDGKDDLIHVPSSISLSNPMTEITIEGWVYSTDGRLGGSIVFSNEGYGFDFHHDEIWILLNGTDEMLWYSGENSLPGWHHYVFTYGANFNVLYIDGQFRAAHSNSGSIYGSEPLNIGWNGFETPFTKGFIDEVRILNSSRLPEWIETEYNNQIDPTRFYSISPMEIYDDTPPIIVDFGVDDSGEGFPQFWANVTDSKSPVEFVTIQLNTTSINMTLNGTGHWIYQPSVNFNESFTYKIINASDSWDNHLLVPSITKYVRFEYDTVAPDLIDWEFIFDEGEYGTFKTNVSDSWGIIDIVIVNVTEGKILQGEPWAVMRSTTSGYMNDTIIMGSGQIAWVVIVNDTAGNSFKSFKLSGYVPITNHEPLVENQTLSRDPNTVLLPVYSNSTLYLLYDYYDQDNHSEAGTEIRWYKNGILQTSYNDQTLVPSSALLKDDNWNVTIKPKDGVDFGNIRNTSVFKIRNTPPSVSNMQIFPFIPFTTSDITINYNYIDYDNDMESTGSREIRWYNDSTLMPEFNDNTTIFSNSTKKGEVWYCQIRVHDGTNFSIWVTSNSVTINNSKPTVVNPTFNKTSGITTDDNISIVYSYYDIDNEENPTIDQENTSKRIIYWYRNGVHDQSKDNDTELFNYETGVDEFWYYSIRVHDGTEYSQLSTSASIVIGTPINNPPEAGNLTITVNPLTTDDLIAYYDYYDEDSHLEAGTEIRWYKNDQLQLNLNDTLTVLASETTKYEVWYFTVRPKDGLEFGLLVQSDNVTIGNSPPTILELILTSNPTTIDDLVANWNYYDVDDDPENNTWIIRWYKDNQLQNGLNNLDVVPFSVTSKGEEWNFTINVFDGANYSIQYNSSTTIIINTPPAASVVSLNTTLLTRDNLTVSYVFYDVDDEPENYSSIIYWYKNNDLQLDLNDSRTVTSGNTSKNEIWYYKIRVFDGENYSSNFYFSPSRLINNTPPILTNVSITTSPTTVTALEASWIFYDEDDDYEIAQRNLYWYKNGVYQPELDDKLTVFSTYTSKGEEWNFTINVFDGTDYSIQFNSSLTIILNSPSIISDVQINDSIISSYADNNLYIDPYIDVMRSDPDQDPLDDYLLHWFKNEIHMAIFDNQTLIPSSELTKGETWYCSVQIFDGEAWSQNKSSQSIVIINKAPAVNLLQIQETVSQEFQIEDINLSITYNFIDIDNDNDLSQIKWYLNNTYQPQFDGQISIPATITHPGDIWAVKITPSDGSDSGVEVSKSMVIESRPSINSFGYQVNDSEDGLYQLWVNVTDARNNIIDYEGVWFEIIWNESILLAEGSGEKNGTLNIWEFNFQLTDYSFINSSVDIIITAITGVIYSDIPYEIPIQRNFSLLLEDKAPPRIIEIFYQFDDENNPKNITFYAQIKELGSDVSNATLFYRYELINISNGGNGASFHQEELWFEAPMTFHNTSGSFTFYSVTIDFIPESDMKIVYWVQASDNQGNVNVQPLTVNLPEFIYEMPADIPDLSDLIPLIALAAIIPVMFILTVLFVRKRRQTQIVVQKRKKKVIVDKISDIFSLRVVICRNRAGVAFYTEKFAGYGQDEDMIAGITSAMSSMVSEIAERKIKSGEYDALEREGFNILSYHGKFTTISTISEEKSSPYMKTKMQRIAYEIENNFTKDELEGLITPELTKNVAEIVLDIIPIKLMKPLTIDYSLLEKNFQKFKKSERKMSGLISEIPSFIDGQHSFYAINFISSLTVHGITLIRAFNYLEKCYDLGIIRHLSEDELKFLDSLSSDQSRSL